MGPSLWPPISRVPSASVTASLIFLPFSSEHLNFQKAIWKPVEDHHKNATPRYRIDSLTFPTWCFLSPTPGWCTSTAVTRKGKELRLWQDRSPRCRSRHFSAGLSTTGGFPVSFLRRPVPPRCLSPGCRHIVLLTASSLPSRHQRRQSGRTVNTLFPGSLMTVDSCSRDHHVPVNLRFFVISSAPLGAYLGYAVNTGGGEYIALRLSSQRCS